VTGKFLPAVGPVRSVPWLPLLPKFPKDHPLPAVAKCWKGVAFLVHMLGWTKESVRMIWLALLLGCVRARLGGKAAAACIVAHAIIERQVALG
jgi:hypothetical protein